MVRRLGLVGEKEEYQNILNGVCTHPTYLDRYTKDILLSMRENQMVKALGYIKVEITRESFMYHWRRDRKNTASSI